jgi:hypothetical protein
LACGFTLEDALFIIFQMISYKVERWKYHLLAICAPSNARSKGWRGSTLETTLKYHNLVVKYVVALKINYATST